MPEDQSAPAALPILVLATRNPGKVEEMRSLLEGVPVQLFSAAELPGAPDVEEDAATLEGNARKKALALWAFSGNPSVADDTGLEVAALGGRPGVHSARFAGPAADDAANRDRLLQELAERQDRSAQFRTVIAYATQDGVQLFEGICRGTIRESERGGGGFGYDRLFVPEGHTRTFAELDKDEKNAVSHRGRAMRLFAAHLRGGMPMSDE